MALYAIGDIQGCMTSLERLLAAIAFDPARDRLWLVGDLVNRGPRSLDVLRWARGLGDRVVAVLGNHDVHLLSRAAGVAEAKKRDTLDDILTAPDRVDLIEWLRACPLVHVEDRFILVHAGLHPRWTAAEAAQLAAEIEPILRGDAWRSTLGELRGRSPVWSPELTGIDRMASALGYFLRVRTCALDGTMDSHFDGHPSEAPKGRLPWFRLPGRAWATHVPVFGHWAALGLDIGVDHIGLDSGCVWGGELTAIRLPDRAVFKVKAAEKQK